MRRRRVDVARERGARRAERVRAAREAVARPAGRRAARGDRRRARARRGCRRADRAARKGVADATVVAPVGGIVTQKLADAGEMVAPRDAAARRHRPRPRLGQPVRARAADAAHHARPGGHRVHRCRRPGSRARSPSSRRRRSSRRATCRRPTSGRSSCTASRCRVDNSAGVLKQGMPVDAELALP